MELLPSTDLGGVKGGIKAGDVELVSEVKFFEEALRCGRSGRQLAVLPAGLGTDHPI